MFTDSIKVAEAVFTHAGLHKYTYYAANEDLYDFYLDQPHSLTETQSQQRRRCAVISNTGC